MKRQVDNTTETGPSTMQEREDAVTTDEDFEMAGEHIIPDRTLGDPDWQDCPGCAALSRIRERLSAAEAVIEAAREVAVRLVETCETCEGTGKHPPGNAEGLGCWDCSSLGSILPSFGFIEDVLLRPLRTALTTYEEATP